MCGRISLFAELGDLASQFRFALGQANDDYRPSWNIAPTASILVVRADAHERLASVMSWGFTFRNRSGGGSSRPLFNARSETLAQRPAFRTAFAERRCLIPANGFYEWRSDGGKKAPMWIHRGDERPFAFAGIYNTRPNEAASVITCEPNSLMSAIHNRMPVILSDEYYDEWLNPDADPEALNILLTSREWPDMTAWEVPNSVNRAGNDGPQLIERVDAETPRLL
jgi:putative SOS response-associated peptidase YedK